MSATIDFRDDLRLLLRYAAVSFRAQMQYRASFVLWSVAQFVGVGVEFLGLWALFHRFGTLRGWTMAQVALLYGIANVAFSLSEAIGRGWDTFSGFVKAGDFDRLLLRPRSTALQVAGSEMQLMRLGRFLQGALALGWGMHAAGIAWNVPRAVLLLAAILGGSCVFYGLFIFQATLCFWTVESLEIMNTVTYGGTEAAQYPLTIYRLWIRELFTYAVPLACMNYLPAQALFGTTVSGTALPDWLPWTAPLVGFGFLAVSLQVWRFGERRYCSTGS